MAGAVTRSRLAEDLRALGVTEGGVLMVHTRMSALGRVDGAEGTAVQALLDALGPGGTLMAYPSWRDHVYDGPPWPAAFDPATAPADPANGRIPERVRTWPGARRSAHPEGSVAAIGARAEWLTALQPDDDAYGSQSPFARLVEARGDVLMLGAPLDTVTLLHHAEALARPPGKRLRTFCVGGRSYTDIDTEHGAYPYAELGLDDDEFATIARAALGAGIGLRGHVAAAECHLFPAAELTAFAVSWLDARFGVAP